MENPHMGRTEQFTEVEFAAPQTEGSLLSARITGQNGTRLTA
jgi:threonylcarbamoyladenosine tRNA methylthiotransferase MtaB